MRTLKTHQRRASTLLGKAPTTRSNTMSTTPVTWTTYDAIAACEGFDGIEHDEAEIISAWQFLIDTGTVWTLQGWFGRSAARLIAGGLCTPANKERAA